MNHNSDFEPIVGRLIRTKREGQWALTNKMSIETWDMEMITIPKDSYLLILSAERNNNSIESCWKMYLLYEEQIVFMATQDQFWIQFVEYLE